MDAELAAVSATSSGGSRPSLPPRRGATVSRAPTRNVVIHG